MSDRKYRQRGYQDRDPRDERPRGGAAPGRDRERPPGAPRSVVRPRDPKTPSLPGFREIVKCTRCGETATLPIVSGDMCSRCGAALHACAQCAAFDPGSRFECMKPVLVRVMPKDTANTCPDFEPRVTVERQTSSAGPEDTRSAFDKLFNF